jgi:Na+-transporting NADH:ubiquinone oxidoreductase subunit NqrB
MPLLHLPSSLMSWRIPLALHSSVSDEWEFGRHLYLTVLEISNINLMLPGKMLTETPEISLLLLSGSFTGSLLVVVFFLTPESHYPSMFSTLTLRCIYDHALI